VPPSLSLPEARRLALGAQGFGNRIDHRAVNRGDLAKLMQRLRVIQLDSVPVIIRTQYMPAFSRLGPYDPALHDDVAYGQDRWFEAWAHEASLLPVESEPLFRWMKAAAREGRFVWKAMRELAEKHPAYVASVRDEIAERGPLLGSELSDPGTRGSSSWGSYSQGALALDWLWRTGELGIRRVGNFEKQFDLMERIIAAEILAAPTPTEEDSLRQLLVQSAEALGVGTAKCLIDYFRLPNRLAKPLIPGLVADGLLQECAVDSWDKPAFMPPKVKIPKQVEGRALLSPFDPVVWLRERALRLYDFHYRIEIYVPKKKRIWGYYVLPFLLDDRIAARADIKTDRKDGVLRIPAAYLEPHADLKRTAAELAAELWQLAELVGVDRVVVGRKGDLVDALRVEVKAHAPR